MSANPSHPLSGDDSVAARLERLEARVASLEHQLARRPADDPEPSPIGGVQSPRPGKSEEELEFEIGENWFARVGILVLAIGGVFLLSLPYPQFPPAAPALAGYVVAAGLFAGARWGQRRFELIANYFRGAAMALLWFATLRLFFFGDDHALSTRSALAPVLLTAVLGANLVVAFRRGSPRLAALALFTGYASAIALDESGFVLATVLGLGGLVAASARRMRWLLPVFVTIIAGAVTYAMWALGDPIRHDGIHVVTAPVAAPLVLMTVSAALAIGVWRREDIDADAPLAGAIAALNSIFGYSAFLLHTGAAFPTGFVAFHGAASVLWLGLAFFHWSTRHSQAPTFFYAMTGYAALSAAIVNASAMPNVFVWLSAESIVVLATAVWFRSRFIVVANFLIYVVAVLGYVVLKERETGISIGIGIVALLSARILNWQKARLELKTELMRNAYLFSAFIIFPYALYHLVPPAYVGLAWVGLAVVYYLLNLIVRSPKYRWMGHATLLFTTVYLVLVGSRQLGPTHRIASFLALGTVLLVVSLTFSRLRTRARRSDRAQ